MEGGECVGIDPTEGKILSMMGEGPSAPPSVGKPDLHKSLQAHVTWCFFLHQVKTNMQSFLNKYEKLLHVKLNTGGLNVEVKTNSRL